MPDEPSSSEEKLQKLGERLRSAVEKLHPLTQQEIEKIRAAVGQAPSLDTEQEQNRAHDHEEEHGPDDDQDHDHDRGR
jgi:DNA anti-recombination protein RmuC